LSGLRGDAGGVESQAGRLRYQGKGRARPKEALMARTENLVAMALKIEREPLQRGLSKALQAMYEFASDDETRGRVAVVLNELNGAIYRKVVRRGLAVLAEGKVANA